MPPIKPKSSVRAITPTKKTPPLPTVKNAKAASQKAANKTYNTRNALSQSKSKMVSKGFDGGVFSSMVPGTSSNKMMNKAVSNFTKALKNSNKAHQVYLDAIQAVKDKSKTDASAAKRRANQGKK